jgi:hypothetical protein
VTPELFEEERERLEDAASKKAIVTAMEILKGMPQPGDEGFPAEFIGAVGEAMAAIRRIGEAKGEAAKAALIKMGATEEQIGNESFVAELSVLCAALLSLERGELVDPYSMSALRWATLLRVLMDYRAVTASKS